MAESFWYNGWHYYQQGRRCGRAGCKCRDGQLHGPYWYRRRTSGYREYVGRELDPRLWEAVETRDRLAPVLAANIELLQTDSALLDAVLRGNEPLHLADHRRLDELGYWMLIPPAE